MWHGNAHITLLTFAAVVAGLMGGRVRFDGRVASVPPLRFGAGPADSAAAASSQPLLEAAADTTMITGSSPPDPFAAATARGPLLPPALQNTIPLPPMLPPLSPGLPPAQALPLLLPPAPLPGAEGLGVPTGGAVAAGPSSSSLLLPGRDSELQPPPPGSWAPASSAPAPQDFDAVEGEWAGLGTRGPRAAGNAEAPIGAFGLGVLALAVYCGPAGGQCLGVVSKVVNPWRAADPLSHALQATSAAASARSRWGRRWLACKCPTAPAHYALCFSQHGVAAVLLLLANSNHAGSSGPATTPSAHA